MSNDNRIKILIISSSLRVGGAEVQLSRLIPRLNRDIFDVQVAYYSLPTGFPKQVLKDAGIRVKFLGTPRWSKYRTFSDAVALIKQQRFDVVHAWHGSSNRYAALPALLVDIPVVIAGMRGPVSFTGILRPFFCSLLNRRASAWIVNSRKLRNLAKKNLWFLKDKPIFQIRNGFITEDTARFRQDENTFFDTLKSDRPVIGIVGNLRPEKNHFLFLQIARLLTDSGVDADYWIIGDGPMKSQLAQAIEKLSLKDRVKMLGYRPDVDVALSRMDVFILTSDFESCPNALLEAMRVSLPVLSTDCTSLENIIEEDLNGHIVPVGDAQAFAQKIKVLLADPDKRLAMGQNSYRILKEHFDITVAVTELQDAYIACLRRAAKKNKKLQTKLETLSL